MKWQTIVTIAAGLLGASLVEAQLAARAVPSTQDLRAAVYLDGSIRAAADNPDQSSIATGAIGVSFSRTRSSLTAQLNIAAKGDTIRTAPGSSLLVPGSGGFSSGFMEGHISVPNWWSWHEGNAWGKRLFLRGYVSATSNVWELPERVVGTTPEAARPVGANALGWGLGLSYSMQGTFAEVTAARIGLKFDAGVVQRLLYGDVANAQFADRRASFLGTADRQFTGIELGMRLGFRDIVGSLTYYTFPWQDGIEGLTKGQIAAGFAISAPILEGKFSEDSRP